MVVDSRVYHFSLQLKVRLESLTSPAELYETGEISSLSLFTKSFTDYVGLAELHHYIPVKQFFDLGLENDWSATYWTHSLVSRHFSDNRLKLSTNV